MKTFFHVIRPTARGFEIAHYRLSIAVPNPVAGKVKALVADFEAQPGTR